MTTTFTLFSCACFIWQTCPRSQSAEMPCEPVQAGFQRVKACVHPPLKALDQCHYVRLLSELNVARY